MNPPQASHDVSALPVPAVTPGSSPMSSPDTTELVRRHRGGTARGRVAKRSRIRALSSQMMGEEEEEEEIIVSNEEEEEEGGDAREAGKASSIGSVAPASPGPTVIEGGRISRSPGLEPPTEGDKEEEDKEEETSLSAEREPAAMRSKGKIIVHTDDASRVASIERHSEQQQEAAEDDEDHDRQNVINEFVELAMEAGGAATAANAIAAANTAAQAGHEQISAGDSQDTNASAGARSVWRICR